MQLLELVKWLLASGLVIGTVFWAGATYNRVSSIEDHLGRIDKSLESLSAVSAIQTRQDLVERELERLRLRIENSIGRP